MFSENSAFRRIPINVSKEQAFFIDGIRHAVEIMELAYRRLSEALTQYAQEGLSSEEIRTASPYVFLDAWSMVDAIDRFRMLYKKFPLMEFEEHPELPPFDEVMQPVRNVRNIGDHLAQRFQQVLSRDGAALGTLSWIAEEGSDPDELWFCNLRPGTLHAIPNFRKERITTCFTPPIDSICLSAGGYEANLSAIRPHIEFRVRHLEDQFDKQFSLPPFKGAPIANDIFHRQPITRLKQEAVESGEKR